MLARICLHVPSPRQLNVLVPRNWLVGGEPEEPTQVCFPSQQTSLVQVATGSPVGTSCPISKTRSV